VAQTEEICDRYDVDGFFFDICFPVPNYSPWGQARMREAGVSPDDERAVLRFAEEKLKGFLERMSGRYAPRFLNPPSSTTARSARGWPRRSPTRPTSR